MKTTVVFTIEDITPRQLEFLCQIESEKLKKTTISGDLIEDLKRLVNHYYKPEYCGYTERRSEGNSYDCFEDGMDRGHAEIAQSIGEILEMKLEEPDIPNDEEFY